MEWYATRRTRLMVIALTLAGGCTAAVPEAGLETAAVHDEGLFELDQNATEEGGAGDDWATVNAPGGGGASTGRTGVLPDAPVPNLRGGGTTDSTTFTGGSKDDETIGAWRHTGGSSADKDEITNAYAASYVSTSGDHIVYFGMDRIATSGNANMGFWFLQSELSRNDDGTFDGEHTVGDILVQVDFASGGTEPTVRVLEWVGTGGNVHPTDTLQLHTEDSADCANMDPGGQDIVCATTNPVATPSPWEYIQKGTTTDGDFPVNSFVEGGINISQIFQGGTVPCFASFVALTRSSDSITAALQDFVMGEFQACGVDLEKTCNAGTVNDAGDGFDFTYTLTITNSGAGTLHDVTVTDDHASNCTPSLGNIGSLTGGQSVVLNCSFSSATNGPFDNTAQVTAASTPGGAVVVDDSDTDECEPATITTGLSLEKTCGPTTVEVAGDRVSVVTSANVTVCNTGNVVLENITVTDDCGTATDASDTVASLTPAGTPESTRCATRQLTCRPNETSSTDPASASFPDRATASGTAPLAGDATVSSPAMSEPLYCYLCPQPG